jgi:adenylate kinase family enzyme
MNCIDKFDVDMEVFLNRLILRKNEEENLKETLSIFRNQKPHVIPYILEKFHKKKCSYCNGKGYLNEDQNL